MTNNKKSKKDIQNKTGKYSTVRQQLQDYDINNIDDFQSALENILDKTISEMQDLGMDVSFIDNQKEE